MAEMTLQLIRTVFLPKGSPGMSTVREIRADIRQFDLSCAAGKICCKGEADLLIEYLSFTADEQERAPFQAADYPAGGGKMWQALLTLPFELVEEGDIACPPMSRLRVGEVKWYMVAPRALEMELELILQWQKEGEAAPWPEYEAESKQATRGGERLHMEKEGWIVESVVGGGPEEMSAERAAGLREQAAGEAERAAGLREQAAGEAERAAGLREQAAGEAERAAGLREQEAGEMEGQLARGEMTRAEAERAAGLREQAAGEAERAAGLREREAGIAERAAGLREREAGIAEREAGLRERAAGEAERAAGLRERAAGDAAWKAALAELEAAVARGEMSAEELAARKAERQAGLKERLAGEIERERGLRERRAGDAAWEAAQAEAPTPEPQEDCRPWKQESLPEKTPRVVMQAAPEPEPKPQASKPESAAVEQPLRSARKAVGLPQLKVRANADAAESAAVAYQVSFYCVCLGDTLAEIASKTGVAAEKLIEDNRLQNRVLEPGMTLRLPKCK